jgi:broad specificity phosphatase PhoE
MDIYLLRHGNTFGPGDKVVWVGKSLDLPLVESGRAQAAACAEALAAAGVKVGAVYCSSLCRTSEYARIVTERLRLEAAPIVDARLDELDYGGWSGLSRDEVLSRFGAEALAGWEKSCLRPANSGWSGSEAQSEAEAREFAAEAVRLGREDEAVLAVSSNGKLRYFLKLAEGAFEARVRRGEFSVKTGNICKLQFVRGCFSVVHWNMTPAEFGALQNG